MTVGQVGAALGPVVLELEQLHPVQVDDRMQAGDVVRIRIAVGAGTLPDVGPADAQPRIPRRHERGTVGPDIGEHAAHVGDAAPGQGLDHGGMTPEHLVALMPLVHGHVRLEAWQVLPGGDVAGWQCYPRPEGLAVGGVPADRLGRARDAARVSG